MPTKYPTCATPPRPACRATPCLPPNDAGYIIKSETATSVRHAFVEENGGRLIMNDIGKGQVALVPAGLVHFLQNMGCSPATFLAAFSSEDPGVVTTTIQVYSRVTIYVRVGREVLSASSCSMKMRCFVVIRDRFSMDAFGASEARTHSARQRLQRQKRSRRACVRSCSVLLITLATRAIKHATPCPLDRRVTTSRGDLSVLRTRDPRYIPREQHTYRHRVDL